MSWCRTFTGPTAAIATRGYILLSYMMTPITYANLSGSFYVAEFGSESGFPGPSTESGGYPDFDQPQ
jgi:hypothetical protein